eukprot:gnl/Trimastix_PCT/3625.p1 GENE.gnl/Trimastix_PCT/3625~~gnl/Trimastix_PCT/3625.p1  ORF type:complete len:138 (-),score=14.16 gnl/Trimastix_PCT/3625:538-951(-)
MSCTGPRTFTRPGTCRYCFQLPPSQHQCEGVTHCNTRSPQRHLTHCRVANTTQLCNGTRVFPKWVHCNWVGRKSRTTTLLLSLTLGGFAVDRFYLGYTGLAVLKLLTLGGLGVWAAIDFVLIVTGFLGPADGSRYAP